MSKRKTAPTKAAQPVPAESARPAEVVKKPSVSNPPKFESQNYPPDDLPEIAQDQLRALREKPELSDGDIELIRREDQRANRKIGFFKARTDRPDAKTREASAGATVVIAGIFDWAMHGAKVQKGRHRGGKKTGGGRKKAGEETRKKVLAERDHLIAAAKSPHEIAGIIAQRVRRSASQVRRIIAAKKKRA